MGEVPKVGEVDDEDVAKALNGGEEAKHGGELERETRGEGSGVNGQLRRKRPTCTTNPNPCLHLSVPRQKHLMLLVQS